MAGVAEAVACAGGAERRRRRPRQGRSARCGAGPRSPVGLLLPFTSLDSSISPPLSPFSSLFSLSLRAEDEAELLALRKAAEARGVATHMVVDAGRTQVAPDSRTVLALLAEGPAVDAVTGSLKLL